MKVEESIEDYLFPDNGELKIEDDLATAQIVDEELDLIDCTFNNDGCVQLNTKGYEYITLSADHLWQLMDLIEAAEEFYEKKFKD
jgi:hypothetical protein